MDWNALTQLITTVGFPIVCCFYLIKTHKDESDKTAETIKGLSEVIQNNTVILTRIYEQIKESDK